jgi:hypothetical protein
MTLQQVLVGLGAGRNRALGGEIRSAGSQLSTVSTAAIACGQHSSCKGLPGRAESMRRILRLDRVGLQIVRQHVGMV